MDAVAQERVRRRADHRCEYGRLHETDDPLFTFHVEHIVAKQHGGTDALSNLHKGPNLTGRGAGVSCPPVSPWAKGSGVDFGF
jgi:hypothetical protein